MSPRARAHGDTMRLKVFSLATALFLGLTCLATGLAEPAEQTVWRIGVFDGSSGEFADGVPHQAVNFVIGKDQPRASWFAYAPVAFPSKVVDQAAAPRDVSFSIPSEPGRAYRLRVSLLIEQSSVPALRVGINGRAGLFYLHPKLDYNMGDTVAAFYPAYARAEVEVDFPGSWLHAGENSISLSAVSTAEKGVPDAGFSYDAIELERLDAMPAPVPAHAEPTIFYQTHGEVTEERIDVFVRFVKRPRSGRVQLSLAGHNFSAPFRPERDFGEERVSFSVPEFAAGAKAELAIEINKHTARAQQTLAPEKKWTLFLVPHVHLDVGYTDYQAKVAAIQSRILDEAMDLVEQHPAFRFSMDGEWNLDQFLKSRTAAERDRIVQAIAERKIYLPAQSSNVLTGFP